MDINFYFGPYITGSAGKVGCVLFFSLYLSLGLFPFTARRYDWDVSGAVERPLLPVLLFAFFLLSCRS